MSIKTWHGGGVKNIIGADIPTGIIIPFNDIVTNIPSGWSQFSLANGRGILGTNTLSEVNTIGGSWSFARSSSTEGGHTGTTYTGWCTTLSGSSVADKRNAYDGAHSHGFTVNYYPSRSQQIFIKATINHSLFPKNSGLLSDVDLSSYGFSQITPDNYLLFNGSFSSNYVSSSSVTGVTNTGGHAHIGGYGPIQPAGSGYHHISYSVGAHSHSAGASITDNIYRFYMSQWSNASSDMAAVAGVYAMWESTTPPAGWLICDGNNGTPDLTNYFIGFTTNSGLWGTKTGNGTITSSGSLNTGGSHQHVGSYTNHNTVSTAYHSNYITHSHSFGSVATSFYPPWYKLVFIKVA